MKPISLDLIHTFVGETIGTFHQGRIQSMASLSLKRLLARKNPYLYRANHVLLAQDLIESLLTAHQSSSEEELFGQFLERLALYIASVTVDGVVSQRRGIDLEFIDDGIYHVVQIKSGMNWGNSSQTKALAQDFQEAKDSLSSAGNAKIRAILGICYGRAKTQSWRGVADRVVGQDFWSLISGRQMLYTEIIEPLGHDAMCMMNIFGANVPKFPTDWSKNYCAISARMGNWIGVASSSSTAGTSIFLDLLRIGHSGRTLHLSMRKTGAKQKSPSLMEKG